MRREARAWTCSTTPRRRPRAPSSRCSAPPARTRWPSSGTGSRASAPDPAHWQLPDTWLDGDHEIAVGARTLDAVHTPGHTPGHFVFADRAARPALRRRPRAADDHPVDRLHRAAGRRSRSGDFMASLTQGPLPAGPADPARPRPGRRRPRTPASTSCSPSTRPGSSRASRRSRHAGGATAYDVAAQLGWTRHLHAFDTLDVFNRGHGVDGDQGPPRPAGRRGRATSSVGADGVALRPSLTAASARVVRRWPR